jgi:hypothetical protein
MAIRPSLRDDSSLGRENRLKLRLGIQQMHTRARILCQARTKTQPILLCGSAPHRLLLVCDCTCAHAMSRTGWGTRTHKPHAHLLHRWGRLCLRSLGLDGRRRFRGGLTRLLHTRAGARGAWRSCVRQPMRLRHVPSLRPPRARSGLRARASRRPSSGAACACGCGYAQTRSNQPPPQPHTFTGHLRLGACAPAAALTCSCRRVPPSCM